MNEKRLVELSHEDKVAFGEKWVDALVELLGKSFEKLLPNLGRVSFEIENRGYEDLQVVLYLHSNGRKSPYGFSIDLIETEQKSIARCIMVPAWQVTGYKTDPATRHHPEETWDEPQSEHLNHWGAAAALVKAVFADNVDGWFESEGEAEAGPTIWL